MNVDRDVAQLGGPKLKRDVPPDQVDRKYPISESTAELLEGLALEYWDLVEAQSSEGALKTTPNPMGAS